MKTFYWLVKREFWEHRGGFLWAPVAVGGVFLLLNLMGIVTGEVMGHHFDGHANFIGNNMHLFDRALADKDMASISLGLDMMMLSTSLLLSIVLGFVVFFYCLGALYDDRRDRSLLFWKSLPISDTATVLSKVVAGAVLAPAITVVCGVLTGLAMLAMFTVTLSLHGVSAWHLLAQAHPLRLTADLVASIPLYVLWALPAFGWLLLCSAWARSKPFLWAVALPVAVGIMLSWFRFLQSFDTGTRWYWKGVLGRLLLGVFPGGWLREVDFHRGLDHALDFIRVGYAYRVLAQPSLWIGVAAGVMMLAGAIWLRRWRDDA